jgi:hypothetical protein
MQGCNILLSPIYIGITMEFVCRRREIGRKNRPIRRSCPHTPPALSPTTPSTEGSWRPTTLNESHSKWKIHQTVCHHRHIATSSQPSTSRPIARCENCCCRNGIGSATASRAARARNLSAGSRRSCTASSGFTLGSEGRKAEPWASMLVSPDSQSWRRYGPRQIDIRETHRQGKIYRWHRRGRCQLCPESRSPGVESAKVAAEKFAVAAREESGREAIKAGRSIGRGLRRVPL